MNNFWSLIWVLVQGHDKIRLIACINRVLAHMAFKWLSKKFFFVTGVTLAASRLIYGLYYVRRRHKGMSELGIEFTGWRTTQSVTYDLILIVENSFDNLSCMVNQDLGRHDEASMMLLV
uniref:AT-hook motif nuclear-localized protein 8-like n=1 Tax=Rhizophora mucronata TaxID=61149 RepID=A0A2P2KDP8_RHIMU